MRREWLGCSLGASIGGRLPAAVLFGVANVDVRITRIRLPVGFRRRLTDNVADLFDLLEDLLFLFVLPALEAALQFLKFFFEDRDGRLQRRESNVLSAVRFFHTDELVVG